MASSISGTKCAKPSVLTLETSKLQRIVELLRTRDTRVGVKVPDSELFDTAMDIIGILREPTQKMIDAAAIMGRDCCGIVQTLHSHSADPDDVRKAMIDQIILEK